MKFGSEQNQYELIDEWAKLPDGWTFVDVCGITIDKDDNVFVLNRGKHPVMVFDQNGNFLRSWGEGFFGRAHLSTMGSDDSIYCTDDRNHIVAKFSLDGKLLKTLGNKGVASDSGYGEALDYWEQLAKIQRGAPPFNRPTGVSLAQNGDLYISDGYGNARIHKFSSAGQLQFSWGEPGGKHGEFRLPHSVRLDSKGRVFVVDRENHRVQIFDPTGKYLTEWTDFVRPTDLFIGRDNLVYVSELCRRVGIFTIDGELLCRWGNTSSKLEDAVFVAPHTVAADSHGDIYVGEVSMTIMKMDRGAREIRKFRKI